MPLHGSLVLAAEVLVPLGSSAIMPIITMGACLFVRHLINETAKWATRAESLTGGECGESESILSLSLASLVSSLFLANTPLEGVNCWLWPLIKLWGVFRHRRQLLAPTSRAWPLQSPRRKPLGRWGPKLF